MLGVRLGLWAGQFFSSGKASYYIPYITSSASNFLGRGREGKGWDGKGAWGGGEFLHG